MRSPPTTGQAPVPPTYRNLPVLSARAEVEWTLKLDPGLDRPEHRGIQSEVRRRFAEHLDRLRGG